MAKPKVGVIGTGQVGQVLADGFVKHGYPVLRGSRDPSKLADWKARAGAKASIGTFAEEHMDLMASMSLAANRPLKLTVLGITIGIAAASIASSTSKKVGTI